MAIGANERRIIELMVKATGTAEVKRMASELKQLRVSAQSSQDSLSRLTSGLGTAAKGFIALKAGEYAAQAIRAVVAAGQEAIDTMDELSVQITKVGVAAADLQKLQYAAKLSNVDLGALNKGMTVLAKSIVDLDHKNGPATKALRELGVTAGTSTFEAMKKLADQIASMEDGPRKLAVAQQYFKKGAAELIPVLNLGSEGLEKMGEEAESLGLILSGESLAAANAFNDELDRVSAMADAATQQFVGGLAPALTALAQEFIGAAEGSADFNAAGQATGRMLIDVAKNIAVNTTELRAYWTALVLFSKTAIYTAKALTLLLTGNNAGADAAMATAQAAAAEGQRLWQNAEQIGEAAAARIERRYQAARAQAARDGALLDSTGRPSNDNEGGGDSGAKERAARAARSKAAKEEKDETAEMVESFDSLNDVLDELYQKRERELEGFKEQAAAYEEAANPEVAYVRGLKELDRVNQEVGLSTIAYALALEQLNQTRADAYQQLHEQSAEEKKRKAEQEEQRAAIEKVRDEWGYLADSMADATFDIITGTEKIAHAVKKMVATIIAELIRIQAMKFIIKLLGGSGFGGEVGSILGSASGNAFTSGGVVSVPTAHGISGGGMGVMGEAGPEAVLPLQRNAQGKLGVSAGAMGVTVNNYAGAEIGVRQTDSGLQIDVIRRQLADDVRRGGTPFSAALEQTYRVGRQASAS